MKSLFDLFRKRNKKVGCPLVRSPAMHNVPSVYDDWQDKSERVGKDKKKRNKQ